MPDADDDDPPEAGPPVRKSRAPRWLRGGPVRVGSIHASGIATQRRFGRYARSADAERAAKGVDSIGRCALGCSDDAAHLTECSGGVSGSPTLGAGPRIRSPGRPWRPHPGVGGRGPLGARPEDTGLIPSHRPHDYESCPESKLAVGAERGRAQEILVIGPLGAAAPEAPNRECAVP